MICINFVIVDNVIIMIIIWLFCSVVIDDVNIRFFLFCYCGQYDNNIVVLFRR